MKNKNKTKWIVLTIIAYIVFGGTFLVQKSNITVETIYDYTPAVISKNINDDIEYTGLEVTGEEVVPEATEMGGNLFPDIPTWKQTKDNVLFVPTKKQTKGMCYPTSQNYMEIGALLQLGIPVNKDYVFAVDYVYVTRDYKNNIDAGTVGAYAIKRFNEKGYPVAFTEVATQSNAGHESYLQIKDRVIKENRYTKNIVMYPHYTEIANGTTGLGLFLKLDEYRKAKIPVVYRISVRGDKNVAFYHRTVPKILDEKREYTGYAHSLSEGNPTYVFEFEGEPTIHLLESTATTEEHLLKLSVAQRTIYKWEINKVAGEFNPVKKKVKDYSKLKTVTIRYGERSDNVLLLEQYLNSQGYQKQYIDGYFGLSTVTALKNYLHAKTGKWYSGRYWGSISQKTVVK